MPYKDVKYMEMALSLAVRAEDKTYPNPMVGAVIVKDGKVLGKGYHRRSGEDHAEIRAIKSCGKGGCRGATMYVTLEPCNHHGKTPPCSDAIIKSGISRVVSAMRDPNPLTAGAGARKLRKSGIKVETGLLRQRSAEINRKYIKYIKDGMPYVTIKLAQSMDGKIAARDGSSKWISSDVSRDKVKSSRKRFNAIMVGVNTVIQDDPFLLGPGRRGYDTARVVVDSSLKTPVDSTLVKTRREAPLIIATTEKASSEKLDVFRNGLGIKVIKLQSREDRVPLRPLLRELAREGMVSLLVEGGGELAGSFLDDGLADEVLFFIAPKILGGPFASVKGRGVSRIDRALELEKLKISRSGVDILVTGRIKNRR